MADLLIADIGGTRARFALSPSPGAIAGLREYPVADFICFEDAARAFLAAADASPSCALAVAVAGTVTGNQGRLTNADWSIDGDAAATDLGIGAVRVINDFEAVARAVPLLATDDLEGIGGGTPAAGSPRLVLGPGTGLGAAALIDDGRGGVLPIAGEGGHMSLAAIDANEDEILRRLRDRFGHVSAERVISGPGLENLYMVLADDTAPPCPVSEIADRARRNDATACGALGHFAAFLGTVTADLALAFGARGGVYLAGGVLPRLGAVFDREIFRRRFEQKGRFSEYLAGIPTYLIRHPQAGLMGLTTMRGV